VAIRTRRSRSTPLTCGGRWAFGTFPMSADHNSAFREANKALSYLLAHYSPMDPKLQAITDSLPRFADGLYREAQDAARTLLRSNTQNPLLRAVRGISAAITGASAKETALANSIFDLQLTVSFTELKEHLGDNDIASVLVDALLYQATGLEAGSPTEEELLFAGTQNTRGIHKFQVARKSKPLIGDVEAWTFGKEYSAIISGSPLDIAYIVSVSAFSLVARVRARWHIRYLLYRTSPTKEDKQALEAALKKQEKSMQEMIDGFSKTKDV
jgi:hypothetical protein